MTEKIRVALVTPGLGLGGTEKGLVSLATRIDQGRFAPRVVCLGESGPREAALRAVGIPVAANRGEPEALVQELSDTDVVHVFRHGIAEPLVPAAASAAGVRVLIESNIFGARDRSPDEKAFACHLFISMMCLLRYRRQAGLQNGFDERHRVLYLPVEWQNLRHLAPSVSEARTRLGLDPERPVVGRLGRQADLKWRDLLIDMIPHLLEAVPDAQVLLVGTTPSKRARLERLGLLDRVTLLDPVSDEQQLAAIYSACDVVVNASTIGESQGLAIAEAMSLGIPVVACSTPWVDNAQVEFIENGHTGWIANHPAEFAEAVSDLLRHAERREQFGARAQEAIERRLDPTMLTRQLERLYLYHLHETVLSCWSPSDDELIAFADGYSCRAGASFRKLSSRERLDAALARAKETVIRRSTAVRMVTVSARRRLTWRGRWTPGSGC